MFSVLNTGEIDSLSNDLIKPFGGCMFCVNTLVHTQQHVIIVDSVLQEVTQYFGETVAALSLRTLFISPKYICLICAYALVYSSFVASSFEYIVLLQGPNRGKIRQYEVDSQVMHCHCQLTQLLIFVTDRIGSSGGGGGLQLYHELSGTSTQHASQVCSEP